MSVQVRRRREAAAFLSTYVGAQGEILVDTTNNRVQVHDGATPGGWPAARLADVIGRTVVADANYVALATDRTVAVTALTAARTVSLPSAATYPTGVPLLVVDESGACSPALAITVARTGSDTINGAASATIALAYGYLALESNGAGRWTIIDQSTASLAQQAANAVAITGGSISNVVGSFSFCTVGNLIGSNGASAGVSVADRSIAGAAIFYRAGGVTGIYDSSVGNNVISFTGSATSLAGTLGLKSFTVATLPAAGTAGRAVFCANARMQTSAAGALEAAGAGTGGLVVDNGAAWKIAGTNITASA